MIGIVKWFDNHKGYGFLICQPDGKEVYVHAVDVEQPGFEKDLNAGDKVEFGVIQVPKGTKAIEVRRVKE